MDNDWETRMNLIARMISLINLGTDFDLGNVVANKINVNIDNNTIKRDANGKLYAAGTGPSLIPFQTKFVHGSGTASSTWLRHEFTSNNTSNSWGWLVPYDGSIVKIIAQGRGVANKKDLVIYQNDIEVYRYNLNGLQQLILNTTLTVTTGDKIGINLETVTGSGSTVG